MTERVTFYAGVVMNRLLWLIIVSLLLFSLCFGKTVAGSNLNREYSLSTIIIDAGHGGKDPGAISPCRKIYEKSVNLAVALKLAKLIEERTNYIPYLIRARDEWVSLRKRAELANHFDANRSLFISIHCNASKNRKANGVETYIFDIEATDRMAARVAARENAGEIIDHLDFILNDLYHRGNRRYSWEAAWQIQCSLVEDLKMCDRNANGADDECVKKAPFSVLANTNMPAILVELGFITNRVESRKLGNSKFQQNMAKSLLKAIVAYDRITNGWMGNNSEVTTNGKREKMVKGQKG